MKLLDHNLKPEKAKYPLFNYYASTVYHVSDLPKTQLNMCYRFSTNSSKLNCLLNKIYTFMLCLYFLYFKKIIIIIHSLIIMRLAVGDSNFQKDMFWVFEQPSAKQGI